MQQDTNPCASSSRQAQRARAVVSIAGKVTAGKSWDSAPVPHMPTATSQRWNNAWPASQRAAADQRGRRDAGRATPIRIAIPTSRKIKPMSRMKCWLNGPVVVTPGTAKYQFAGEISIKRPFAADARPSTVASASDRFRLILHSPAIERRATHRSAWEQSVGFRPGPASDRRRARRNSRVRR